MSRNLLFTDNKIYEEFLKKFKKNKIEKNKKFSLKNNEK